MKLLKYCMFLLLIGCSSAKMITTWKSPAFNEPAKIKRILVLSPVNQRDRSLQEMIEEKIVTELTGLGYLAESSLKLFGPKAFEGLTEKAALDKINTGAFSGVITVVLLNKHREKRFVQPQTRSSSPLWDYYDLKLNRVYEPGYYVTDTKYFWETNFYEMNAQQLIYSAQTRSFEYETKKAMSNDYGKLIVSDMLKQKVLLNSTIEKVEE